MIREEVRHQLSYLDAPGGLDPLVMRQDFEAIDIIIKKYIYIYYINFLYTSASMHACGLMSLHVIVLPVSP